MSNRDPIYVTRSFLPPLTAVNEFLSEIWEKAVLTNRGPCVVKLEQALKAKLGVHHLLAVNNGTIALQLAAKALGLSGEVITTPFSYVATVSSMVWEGLTPIFADIDPETLNLDPREIERKITPSTSAIVATHVYGNPCAVAEIEAIARRHNLAVIYDAAHAFGVCVNNRSVLNYGDISTLSFHATKLFHTGEGGAVVCTSEDLLKAVFDRHNFGHQGQEAFSTLGINGKLSEIHAAVGLSMVPFIDEIIQRRKDVYLRYTNNLGNCVTYQRIHPDCEYNFSYVPVIFKSEDQLLKVQSELASQNVFIRRYFYPSLDRLPYLTPQHVPIARDISSRIACLPTYHTLANADIDRICQVILGITRQ